MKRRDGKEEERDYSRDTCPRHFHSMVHFPELNWGFFQRLDKWLSLFHSDSVRTEF